MRTAPGRRSRLTAPWPGPVRIGARGALLLGLGILITQQLLAPVGAQVGAAASNAPVAKGYKILRPQGSVANGDLIEFYTYWDSAHYQVEADLSDLDDTLTEPIPAVYVGDSVTVSGPDTTRLYSRYWLQVSLSEANGRDDAAEITVPVTATHTELGTQTTLQTVRFCLLNHPPRHVESRFVGAEERFTTFEGRTVFTARNGDSLRIETEWAFATRPFEVTADFSAADDAFDAEDVFYWLVGQADSTETYSIFYELSDDAYTGTSEVFPIRVQGADGACGRDSVVLELLFDNEGPSGAPVLHALPDTVTTAALDVSGRAPDGSHDVLVVLNGNARYVFDAHPLGDSLIFEGTVTLSAGLNTLVAYGRDVVGNRSEPSDELELLLENAPLFKGYKVARPESVALGVRSLAVANGDPVEIQTYWDSRDVYEVTGDFSRIDAYGDPALRATRRADIDTVVTSGGQPETWFCYVLETTISEDNTYDDEGNVVIPIWARDTSTGIETRTETVRLCLYNSTLEHRGSEVIGDSARFVDRGGQRCYVTTNGDVITIQTTWATPNRPMSILPDFIRIDRLFQIEDADLRLLEEVSSDTVATYEIVYNLWDTARLEDDPGPAYPLPVLIEGRDSGCASKFVALYFEMDIEPPEGAPAFDPAPPSFAVSRQLSVSGAAQDDAHSVVIEVEHLDADPPDSTSHTELDIDEQSRFAGDVALHAGRNRITAYGRDLVGNWSRGSDSHEVSYVTQSQVVIPQPFEPGLAFTFDSLTGWSSAEVEIYNLEGDRVRSWRESSGGGLLNHVTIEWDGRNATGEFVRQGPYLLRYRMTGSDGRTAVEEVKAFVFKK